MSTTYRLHCNKLLPLVKGVTKRIVGGRESRKRYNKRRIVCYSPQTLGAETGIRGEQIFRKGARATGKE
jgi:hypothetical protein